MNIHGLVVGMANMQRRRFTGHQLARKMPYIERPLVLANLRAAAHAGYIEIVDRLAHAGGHPINVYRRKRRTHA